MITVVDPEAARAALAAGDLACPESRCAGTLRIWSPARVRCVQLPDGQRRRLRPDRARCRACGVTHVLLPAWCLPRRAYSTDTVGTALLAAAQGAGYAGAAAAAGAPIATVRDWLRAVGRSAPALTAQAVTIAGAAGEADLCWPRPTERCSALTSAVHALGAAARAFHLVLIRPRPAPTRGPGPGTDIDYLAILGERHRRQLLHDMRLVDPTGAATGLTPWQAINVLTAGRLLTARRGSSQRRSVPCHALPRHDRPHHDARTAAVRPFASP